MAVQLFLNSAPSSGVAPVTGKCVVRVKCAVGDLNYALNSGKYYVTIYANDSPLKSSTKQITGSSKTSIDVTTNKITLSDPGTYTLCAYLTDAKGNDLGYASGTRDVVVKEKPVQEFQQKIVYRSGSKEAEQTIWGEGTIRGDKDLFDPPSGFTFWGWAASVNQKTPDAAYAPGKTYKATSTSNFYLYAVWKCENDTGVTFYYGYNMSATNYRKLLGYAYNTSSSRQTTEYESVKTPAMTAGNITVAKRSFSPIGWRGDTENNGSDLKGGNQFIAVSQKECVFYAVYQNTSGIHVSYNSNGGSGAMDSVTVPGTMYYNTAKTSPTTINVTPRACTFTPPKGYQFKGWSTSASGSLVTSINTSYDATFYAQWISTRPADWDWSGYLYLNGVKTPYNMTVGGKPPMVKQSDGSYYAYYMGAAEWNKFVKRIEEVASYLGISLNVRDINGASATAGQKLLTYQAQCIVNMLNTLGASNVPAVPISMSVSFFNGIRDSLNNRKNR